jgi:hypothetical protein
MDEPEHASFPSIPHFDAVVHEIQHHCKCHLEDPPPKIVFHGTVKLHGTNGGVMRLPDGRFRLQSRNRFVSLDSDNMGFAKFMSELDLERMFEWVESSSRKEQQQHACYATAPGTCASCTASFAAATCRNTWR